MCAYRISQVFEARYYKGNPDLIINRMIDMKYEMLKKFGTVYDDELEWRIHVSVYHILHHYLRNYLQTLWGDEEFLGSKIVVEDFPLSSSMPQITLVYKKRIGDYRMEIEVIKNIWDTVRPSYSTIRPRITKVIFNNPATIVYWDDGTKTVVKCQNESFDSEKGLAMAICKKLMGLKEFYKHYNIAIDDEIERISNESISD